MAGKKKKIWKATVKQERFVDFYILHNGNGVKAVEAAGYEGNNATLRATASRLLTNNNILALIEKRREEAKSARIADIAERQEILTEIYRNKKAVEVPETVFGAQVGDTEDGETKIVRVTVTDKDKIKAIDTHNKMGGLYVQKHEVGLSKELLSAVLRGLPEGFGEVVRSELVAAFSKQRA